MAGNTAKTDSVLEIVRSCLAEAVAAPKCHTCGCLHKTVAALDATESGRRFLRLELARAREVFAPKKNAFDTGAGLGRLGEPVEALEGLTP